jgi:hypothetical protein
MTDTLSKLSTDAAEAFRAESAGNVVMPPTRLRPGPPGCGTAQLGPTPQPSSV